MNKIVDMKHAIQLVKNKKLIHGAGTFTGSDVSSWEKKKQVPVEKQKQEQGSPSPDSSETATATGDEKEEDVKVTAVPKMEDKDKVTKGKEKEKEREKKEKQVPSIVYYPALPMAIVPVKSEESASLTALSVGTIVQCQVAVNWFQQRLPLYACNIAPRQTEAATPLLGSSREVADTNTSLTNLCLGGGNLQTAGRVKGTIIRLKINTTLGFDISEISLNEEYRTKNGPEDSHYYYCDCRELRGADSSNSSSSGSSSRDSRSAAAREAAAHVGDLVEFLPAVGFCIAACPVVIKPSHRMGPAGGNTIPTNAKRNIFNSSLQGGSSAGVKSITMAEGPKGDSVGFVAGWRGSVNVNELPWGRLLGHLAEVEKTVTPHAEADLDVVLTVRRQGGDSVVGVE